MSEASVMTDELRKQIGVEGEPLVVEMEKGMLRKFVDAIGDPNPLWSDEEYAKKTKYGGLTFPPGILAAIMMVGNRPPIEIPLPRGLDGGGEWEFFEPIRPGDTLTIECKIGDLVERQISMGKAIFIYHDTVWKNQKGQVVATSRTYGLKY